MNKLVDQSTAHTYQRVFSEVEELEYYRHNQEDNTHNNSQWLRPTKKQDEQKVRNGETQHTKDSSILPHKRK